MNKTNEKKKIRIKFIEFKSELIYFLILNIY